jgi:hypothetical protein
MHDIEPFPPLGYLEDVDRETEGALPIFDKDGEDDMRCSRSSNLFLPFSFSGSGIGGDSDVGLPGVDASIGNSMICSSIMCSRDLISVAQRC